MGKKERRKAHCPLAKSMSLQLLNRRFHKAAIKQNVSFFSSQCLRKGLRSARQLPYNSDAWDNTEGLTLYLKILAFCFSLQREAKRKDYLSLI